MTDSLQKKIDFAIKLLRAIPQDNGPIEISFSGGKDSEVILELAKMAGINYRAIYKNTTVDPPGTIAHCKSKGVEVLNPKKTFFELMRQKGAPTRWSRFCCEHLKEYKVLDRAVQGVRRCESAKRAERYHEPEICRTYPKGEKARIYLPILEWTNADVAEFINERAIKCHSLYYDEGGVFHPERRLGCLACPLASQRQCREQFMGYPKLLKAWIVNLQIFINNHPKSVCAKVCEGSAHKRMFFGLFCESRQQFQSLMSGGMFPETAIDAKQFLEDYFKIDLTI